MDQRRLFRLLWLSIAAAVATITLKLSAWALTGSVGLLSDAAESVVNLVAALVHPQCLARGSAHGSRGGNRATRVERAVPGERGEGSGAGESVPACARQAPPGVNGG